MFLKNDPKGALVVVARPVGHQEVVKHTHSGFDEQALAFLASPEPPKPCHAFGALGKRPQRSYGARRFAFSLLQVVRQNALAMPYSNGN